MKFSTRIFIFVFTTFFCLLTSCRGPILFQQTENNIADVKCRVNKARCISNHTPVLQPSLLVKKGMYVDRTPISLTCSPPWLKNHIVIRGEDLPFSYFVRVILGNGHVLTRYQVGLDPSPKLTMNYEGTVQGALNLLAAKSGYFYSVNGNNVYWQALITRMFDIAFMPGRSDYLVGKSASASGGPNPIAGGGTSGAAQITGIIDDSASQQYSNMKGTLSVWADIESTIRQLLSPEGRVMVSEATSSVTVRDRPTNVELVSQFICNLNKNLSKQVLIKVQILSVDLSNAFNFGINWDVVQNAFGHADWILNANFGTPVSITPLTGGAVPTVGLRRDPLHSGVGALINALQQQGKVSIVTEPRVICQNNQVGVIRIVNQEGFIASIQNTTVAGAGGATNPSITTQITPGTLVTGLTLYILPKILNNRIYLQVNADLSSKIAMDSFSSTNEATPGATRIMAPRITQKQFNQRSVIGSGDTLILSGFRQVRNETGAMQLFDSQALGGAAAQQTNTETVVLITPIILHGYV